MCTQSLPAAIDVMRAIASHHRHLSDDFVIMGLPNADFTLAHCRALAAMPLVPAARTARDPAIAPRRTRAAPTGCPAHLTEATNPAR